MTEPRSMLSAALLLACAAAWAQPAPSPSAAASAAERAQKETDRTMYWIRVLADKPAPVKASAAPRPVAAVATTAKAGTEAREKVKVAAASPNAATSTVASASSAEPPPVGRGLDPAQALVGDLPEPSALSSNSAGDAALLLPEVAPPPVEPDPGLVQIKSVQPEFPSAVVKRFHKGNVEVQFEVDTQGKVVEATVVESSNARLNEAAMDAVKQWRFKPTPKAHTAAVNLIYDIDNEK